MASAEFAHIRVADHAAEALSPLASAAQSRTSPLPPRRWCVSDNWSKLTLVLIIGYFCMGRAFAYAGLPWFSLYMGELALASFLLFGPRIKNVRWVRLVRHVRQLQRFKWLLALLLCYGAFESLRGMFLGYPAFTAARDTAFNYYPLFLFLGIWVGLRNRSFLRELVRPLAWWNGCYGIMYVLFLNRVPWAMPGTATVGSVVPVFSEPLGSAISLLGLLTFEPQLKRVWHLLVLNAVVMLWVQMRAEWLGFAVGLTLLAWFTKRLKQMAVSGLLLGLLFGFMLVTNLSLPSPEGRGGQISADDIIARGVAPVNKDLASDLAPAHNVVGYVGTAAWRLVWWARIWAQVHESASGAWFGFGYGYPIGELNPFLESGYFIQTPHNDFLYALAYSGWIGVTLFALLEFELVRLLWRSYQITGEPFGLVCWAALITVSMFGDFFEAPMGAIPFYLLVGVAVAPMALCAKRDPLQGAVSAPAPA